MLQAGLFGLSDQSERVSAVGTRWRRWSGWLTLRCSARRWRWLWLTATARRAGDAL